MRSISPTTTLETLASQCVRCGLCLPHCPTYRLAEEEPESPRGRISMLGALAQQTLDWSPELQRHMDQCLGCGHCERVCPAGVSYDALLIQGRAALAEKKPLSWKRRLAIMGLENPFWRQKGYASIKMLYRLRLWNVLSRAIKPISPTFLRMMSYVSVMPQETRKKNIKGGRKKVLLFKGCTGSFWDQPVLEASQQLLMQLGYEAVFLKEDLCCGALSAHAGLGMMRQEKTREAIAAFCLKENISDVISMATGCGSFIEATDIQMFLLTHGLEQKKLKKISLRVAVHTPCTQVNAMSARGLSEKCLALISGATYFSFGEKTCCGAAGSYMFDEPIISEALVRELLSPPLLASCDVIVTSNIGCRLQFQRFLKQEKISLRVCHPVELLAECL